MLHRGWISACIVFGLAACGDEPTPAPVAPPSMTPEPAEIAVTFDAAPEDGEHPAFDGRDPFEDLYSFAANRPAEDLSGLRVTAIVTGTAVPRALVIGPDGVGRSVRVGDLLGPGVIVRIDSGRVVVKTGYRTAEGGLVSQLNELKLHQS